MHFTPNIYCSFKLDRRKGQCFFGDHNAGSLFLIERSLRNPMHFTPNIYCSFKLDRRKGQCFFGDHNGIVIPYRKISPSDNCNCQCCQQEDASSFEKKKGRRCKFSLSLLSLSFFSFFSILKCFSSDLFWCCPHSKMLNYLFRRKL